MRLTRKHRCPISGSSRWARPGSNQRPPRLNWTELGTAGSTWEKRLQTSRSRVPVDLASFRLFPERTCQRLAKEVRASRRAKVLLGGRDRYQTELLQHEKPVEHQMERCVFALAEAKHLDVADLD